MSGRCATALRCTHICCCTYYRLEHSRRLIHNRSSKSLTFTTMTSLRRVRPVRPEPSRATTAALVPDGADDSTTNSSSKVAAVAEATRAILDAILTCRSGIYTCPRGGAQCALLLLTNGSASSLVGRRSCCRGFIDAKTYVRGLSFRASYHCQNYARRE